MPAPRGQSGRLMEIPVLIALAGIAVAVGIGERSWIAGLLAFVGIPLVLFVVITAWEVLALAWLLAKAKRAMRATRSRLDGVRSLEASALGFRNVRWLAARAGQALVGMLDDESREIRISAAHALVRMARELDKAAPPLIEALQDKEHLPAALDGLSSLGPRAAAAVPALIGLLHHRNAPWWWTVVMALQSIGPAARPAVPALIAAMEELPADRPNWPIYALGAIGDRRALPALEKVANESKDEHIRETARDAIARIEAGGHPANQP
jgi:HEAT repeat protein